MGSPGSDQIRREELLTRIDGDVELLAELVEIFEEDLPGRFDEFEQAIRADDMEALHRAAHSFKGSVGNFAARSAFEMARRLDEAALGGHRESVHIVLDQLRKEVESLVPALHALLAELR